VYVHCGWLCKFAFRLCHHSSCFLSRAHTLISLRRTSYVRSHLALLLSFIKVMWLGEVLFLAPQFLSLFPWWAGSIVEMCASRFTGGTLRVLAFCGLAYAGRLVTWTAHMFTQSVYRRSLLRMTMMIEILVPSAVFELLCHLHRLPTFPLHTFVRVGCNGKRHSCNSHSNRLNRPGGSTRFCWGETDLNQFHSMCLTRKVSR